MPNGLSAIGITSRQWAAWVLLLKPITQLTLEDWEILREEKEWLTRTLRRVNEHYPDIYNAQYASFMSARANLAIPK